MDYSKTALIEVDIQNDFCPAYTAKDGTAMGEGVLAVKDAEKIIAPLNFLASRIKEGGGTVLATQDWHPPGHVSFASSHGKKPGDMILISISDKAVQKLNEQFPDLRDPVPAAMQQILWPDHCVQLTRGADFHDELETVYIDYVFRKGFHTNIDSYSAFFENDRCTPTDLPAYLAERGIGTVLVAGLATDYCVFHTVIDALRLGYRTERVLDASAAVDFPPDSQERAIVTMRDRGVIFASVKDFA
ncbi:MAG: nicotinamidase [Treponema sp.]|nr:nicotinamidase [Treponema sp.]